MTTDTLSKTSPAPTGPYAGDYLWSNAANWSAGLPTSSSQVVLALTGGTSAVDQSYSVNTINWSSAGSLVIGGALTASSLVGSASGRTATNLSVLAGGSLTTTGTGITLADASQASFAGTENTQQFSFSSITAAERSSSFSISAGSFTATTGIDLTGAGTASVAAGATMTTSLLKLYSATMDIAGTATISSLASQSGGNATIEGKVTVAALGGGGQFKLNSGGSLEVTGNFFDNTTSTGADSFNLNGGTLTIDSLVSTINAGTSFTFGATGPGGSGASLLNLANKTSGTFGFALNTLDLGDKLQFGTAVFKSAAYNNTTKTLTLTGTSSSLALTNVTFAADVGTPNFSLSSAANGGSIITVNCFLAGTRIATPAAEVAIERLAAGDLVLTMEGGRQVAHAVKWAGWRQIDLRRLDDDAARAAAPIRIRAHAFADNIPARDLLLTGDHGILIGGLLIPAHMLVNGASIVRESECIEYRIHHLELETHAILLAEGLAAESYFGPADHPGFNSTDPIRATQAACDQKLAAPRRTDRNTVEPIWHRLSGRAAFLGFATRQPGCAGETSTDAELCLKLAGGATLHPTRRNGARYFFVVPAHTHAAVLQSRSAIPAEIEGPFVDDRRRLGVCVRAITLWTDLRSTAIRTGNEGGSGWHPRDRHDGGCWTNGAGSIVLPDLGSATILEIECSGTMRYSIDEDASARLQA